MVVVRVRTATTRGHPPRPCEKEEKKDTLLNIDEKKEWYVTKLLLPLLTTNKRDGQI